MELTKLLEKIYYTPEHSGSFSSADRLQKVLKFQYGRNEKKQDIEDWLIKQRGYTLHKPIRHKFPRNKTIAKDVDAQWQADLMFLPELAKWNNRIKIFLVVIDIVSRFAWVRPMKKKTATETTNAFDSILVSTTRRPTKLQTDAGKEFLNAPFQKLLQTHNISHFVSNSDKKAAIAERFNKTIKTKIYKYIDGEPNRHKYIDVLQKLVDSYNDTFHSSIGMKPNEVNESTSGTVLENLYGDLWTRNSRKRKNIHDRSKLAIGDHVRLAGVKNPFTKDYKGMWTEELFTISQILSGTPNHMFKLKDLEGEPLEGKFYATELQKVHPPEEGQMWQIEKVIKKRSIGGKKELFVKWFGYPDKFNSWIPESDLG